MTKSEIDKVEAEIADLYELAAAKRKVVADALAAKAEEGRRRKWEAEQSKLKEEAIRRGAVFVLGEPDSYAWGRVTIGSFEGDEVVLKYVVDGMSVSVVHREIGRTRSCLASAYAGPDLNVRAERGAASEAGAVRELAADARRLATEWASMATKLEEVWKSLNP